MEFLINNPEALWVITVFYDLLLASLLFYFFGKDGLYLAIVLGIVLSNLQGGKVSDVVIFDRTFTVSMGAIMYSCLLYTSDAADE